MATKPKNNIEQQANKNISKKANSPKKPKVDYDEKIVVDASFEELIKELVTPIKK